MIHHWNREIKRQGSASRTRSLKNISQQIEEVSEQEASIVTSKSRKISDQELKKIAKRVDDLYRTFPANMADSLHKKYQKQVQKKIQKNI